MCRVRSMSKLPENQCVAGSLLQPVRSGAQTATGAPCRICQPSRTSRASCGVHAPSPTAAAAPPVSPGSGGWEDAPNFGVFHTWPEHELDERAGRYHFELAKSLLKPHETEDALDQIYRFGLETPNEQLAELGLKMLGGASGTIEYGSKLSLIGPGNSLRHLVIGNLLTESQITSNATMFSHLGATVAVFQLAADLYHQRPLSDSLFTFLKGMAYWQGEDIARNIMSLGKTAAVPKVSVALAALFFLELYFGPIETWNDEQYVRQPEHKKLFGAYREFYETEASDGGLHRTDRQWADLLDEMNQQIIRDPAIAVEAREQTYAQRVHAEIERYAQAFFELPMEQKVQRLVNNEAGFLYGKWALLHFEGEEDMPLHVYINRVREGKVPGMTLSFAEAEAVRMDAGPTHRVGPGSNEQSASAYLAFFDSPTGIYRDIRDELTKKHVNHLIKERIPEIMRQRREAHYLARETELRRALDTLRDQLNAMVVVRFIGSHQDKIPSIYAHHLVVPVSEELKANGTLSKWMVTLDRRGNGELAFTNLAHIRAGVFHQFAIYAPEDKDRLTRATPVAVVDTRLQLGYNDVMLVDPPGDLEGFWEGTWRITDASKARDFLLDRVTDIMLVIHGGISLVADLDAITREEMRQIVEDSSTSNDLGAPRKIEVTFGDMTATGYAAEVMIETDEDGPQTFRTRANVKDGRVQLHFTYHDGAVFKLNAVLEGKDRLRGSFSVGFPFTPDLMKGTVELNRAAP